MPGQVLIVDGVPTNRIVMRVKLAAAFFETRQAATGTEALDYLARPGIALAIIDARLPDMDGVEVIRRARARPGLGDLPMVLITLGHDPAMRLAALRAGADEVLERPLDETLLIARIRCLIRASDSLEDLNLRDGSARALGLAEPAATFARPARVAVLAAHVAATQPLAEVLNRRATHRITRHDIASLLHDLPGGGVPDLAIVMLDGRPDDSALQAIASLRARPEYRSMAILALLPGPNRALSAEAMDRGADDEMSGPLDPDEMLLRAERLIRRKRRADRLRDTLHDGLRAAVTDPLTGLHNRRYALPRLSEMAQSMAAGTGGGLAVMVADIDHFKQVNDTYGHAIGDAVLVEVARRLRSHLSAEDLIARIGGEEFLIALSGQDTHDLKGAARRLCAAVGTQPIRVRDCPNDLRVTVSIGLAMACAKRPALDAKTLLDRADRALYHSKMLGRNKVTWDTPAA